MVFEGLFASAKEKSKGETPLPTTTSSSSGNTGTKSKRKHSRSKKKKKAAIINTNTSSNESKSAAIISTQPQQSQSRQNNNNGSRKTGPSAISTRTQPTRMHTESRQNNNNGFRKRGPTPEAMLLSSKLKEFSTQKRLQEILELYHDRANDYIRDGHHACIVVDCCARCGCIQKGEEIVEQLKQSGDEISVQTITALLKGYAHSGMMDKAAALYIAMTKKRNNRDKPNIRTLNTMLRGCMWAAASCKVNGMNHLTSEYIWPSPSSNNHNHIIPDTSSYEYSISVLSQALRCNDAQKRLEEFMNAFGVKISKDTDNCNQNQGKHFSASDPSALETLGVCFFNIARAYALLGDHAKAIEYANNSMDVVSSARSTHQSNRSNGAQNQAGGKRAWKSSNDGKDDSRREGNDYSRRTESNSLFRAHKLNELESDVRMILSSSSDTGGRDKLAARSLARFLITRVLYFSGGGTTDLSASASFDSESENAALDPNHERRQLIDSLWLCFGLRAAMKKEFPDQVFESRNGGFKFSKILKSLNISKSYVLLDDGAVDFNAVFASVSQSDKDLLGASQETKSKRPLNIELGSGFGEWIVNQALNTPSSDYIAVELRSDRVGQMFSKALLHDKNSPIQNLCCVGSECGSFLRKRVKEASISKIFVNHPEPPTQTFGANNLILKNIADGGEEPAHMLNSQTLISAARCLDKRTGKLIIVTDNRFYANLICATLIKVMNKNEGIFVCANLKGMQQIQVFDGKSKNAQVILYEGQPNKSIDHTTSDDSQKGSTYFDRLWRKGAGNHAQTHKRFIICMHRSKQNEDISYKSSRTSLSDEQKGQKVGKNKRKRSQLQQQKRNERRLNKKSGPAL